MAYYLRKYWKENALAFFLLIVKSFVSAASNVAMIELFQSIFEWSIPKFATWAAVMLGISLLQDVLNTSVEWSKSRAKMAMDNCFRRDITATVLAMPYQQFHEEDIGSHLSKYTNDISRVTYLAWGSIYAAVSLCSSILFNIVALAYMHWSLLAISILIAVVIVNAPKLFEKQVQSLSQECSDQVAQATGKLKDLLSGFDVFFAFGQKDLFRKKAEEVGWEMELPAHKLLCTNQIISNGIGCITGVLQLGVLFLIGMLSLHGVIVQAALTGCCNMCSTVYGGLSQIGQQRLDILASKPYFDKITVHADEISTQTVPEIPELSDSIEVNRLCFQYDSHPVLQNLCLSFRRGGKYALTGPSGCGKSTLLKILLGWLPSYTGSITYDGKELHTYSAEQLQTRIGYIEQNIYLLNGTILENITLGRSFSQEQIQKALQSSALEHDIQTLPLGLDTPVGENGSSLSGGQKQRVAIARALLQGRTILLVDEGTSALDAANADIVEESLLADENLTLILVSHHLSDQRKAQFDAVYELEAPVPQEAPSVNE